MENTISERKHYLSHLFNTGSILVHILASMVLVSDKQTQHLAKAFNIHFVAGILSVILQAPRETVKPHLRAISTCIFALCSLVKQSGGHLPSSLPEREKSHHLVQICHGSPGFLLLLATMRSRFPESWQPDWEEAEAMACNCVWEEGLLRKGLGLCHGISGNAWPLLLLGALKRGSVLTEFSLVSSDSLAQYYRRRCCTR